MVCDPSRFRAPLGWTQQFSADPAQALIDWLAHDIDPRCADAVSLLTSPGTSAAQFTRAKNAYKSLRLMGETVRDRQLAARYYLASIAGALVIHNQRISEQSDEALRRALRGFLADRSMPAELIDVAEFAQSLLVRGVAPPATPAGPVAYATA